MSEQKTNKLQVALVGSGAAPTFYHALQLSFGLANCCWERVLVIGSSPKDGQYQHIANYSTLGIAKDATPSRYTELLNLAAGCQKDVIIFSNLSDEWQYGITDHLNSAVYEDLLKTHRYFFHAMRHVPVHVIACFETKNLYLQKDEEGKRRLSSEVIVQQAGIEKQFATVLRVDKKGHTQVWKDATGVFDASKPFSINPHHGVLLAESCAGGRSVICPQLQAQIDGCTTLAELYQLLFDQDTDDLDVLSAFTRRRIQLDEDRKEPTLQLVPGGLLL